MVSREGGGLKDPNPRIKGRRKKRAVIVNVQPGGTATTLVMVIFYLEARGMNGHTEYY